MKRKPSYKLYFYSAVLSGLVITAMISGTYFLNKKDSLYNTCQSVKAGIKRDEFTRKYDSDVINTRKSVYNTDCKNISGQLQ